LEDYFIEEELATDMMHYKFLLLSAVFADAALGSDAPTPTASTVYATQDPARWTTYHNDMSSLHAQIQNEPLFTSMRNALKTAVPQSYKDAMSTNPSSVRAQFKTSPPDWYTALPSDVKGFMESQQQKASSIWAKDFAVPTGQAQKGSTGKSEASQLSLVGATVGAVVGALGLAALLL